MTRRSKRSAKAREAKDGRTPGWAVSAAVLAGLLSWSMIVYARALSAPLVWEDEINVLQHDDIRGFGRVFALFTSTYYEGSGTRRPYYRPFVDVTLALSYALGGTSAFAHHFMSVLVHALCAWCLFVLMGLLRVPWGTRVFLSLLFVSHPVGVESVAYVANRHDPLVGLFSAAGVGLWIRWRDTGRWGFLAGAAACLAGGLFSKESGAALPLLVLLYEAVFAPGRLREARPWLGMALFGAMCGAYVLMRSRVLGSALFRGSDGSPIHASAFGRLATGLRLVPDYLGKFVWPADLHPDRLVEPSAGWTDPRALLALAAAAALIAAIWVLRKRAPLASFGLGWFLIGFLPVCNLIPIRPLAADRFAYLPYAGLALALAPAVEALLERARGSRREALAALALLPVAALSTCTVIQTGHWTSLGALAQRVLRYNPESFSMHANLGVVRFREGRLDEAERSFAASVRVKPGYGPGINNLGAVVEARGDLPGALSLYERAIRADPAYILARRNRADLLVRTGRLGEAADEWRRILAITPGDKRAAEALARFEALRRRGSGRE